ncbi:MAG: hypothetical protein GX957_01305, partial [Clostridiaceae bacterium]|nr:hypothetical protein [Clostridiaceae bacterium]
VFSRNMVFGDPYRWTLMEEPFHSGVEYYIEDFGGIWNKMQRYTYKADVANETEASSISAEYGADWEALRKEYYLNVIMGNEDLEEGWDTYIDSLNALEYQDYCEELNKVDSIEEILNSID